jgi:hypothetical protein
VNDEIKKTEEQEGKEEILSEIAEDPRWANPVPIHPPDKFHLKRTDMVCVRLEKLIQVQEETNNLLGRLVRLQKGRPSPAAAKKKR